MARRKRGRRKPGTGYATEAPNKTWTGYFPKFGGGYHTRRGFDTRETAEDWLDSLVDQQKNKIDVSSGQQLTDAWLDKWINRTNKEQDWKAKMLADVMYKLGYVKPFIGAITIADVLPDHIDSMFDVLSSQLAQNTIKQIRNYLWRAFEAARERRYILFNPVLKPGRGKRAKQKAATRLSAPQCALLLVEAMKNFYGIAWWLIVCCGLRAGEVCGLRRSDIDIEQSIINVSQEVTDLRGQPHFDLPKGDKTRKLPVPRPLMMLLVDHLERLNERARKGLKAGTWQEHGLVFPGQSGRPLNPTSLRHNLKRMTDTLKLPPVTTHMIRHTSSKLLLSVGTPENIIGGILGHAPNITGHYAKPEVDEMRPWVEKVYREVTKHIKQDLHKLMEKSA